MEKWVLFIVGALTGTVLTIGGLFYYHTSGEFNTGEARKDSTLSMQKLPRGAIIFEKPERAFEEETLEVSRTVANHTALVTGKEKGQEYLLTNDESKFYYDNEIIIVPREKMLQQIGVYHSSISTVPIVRITGKDTSSRIQQNEILK
ncbi:MAG: hypothetical protein K6D57_05815 [Paludibacteraceae bacterium]|nr:hypothetical protein [Paludibacteraceae bacterium]